MKRYRGRYRIESARLPGYDYTTPGRYHVVICTAERACFFGDVRDGTMMLSPTGQIVAEEWSRTPSLRPYVALDAWAVMPNHVHGIVTLLPGDVGAPRLSTEAPRRDVSTGTVATLRAHSLGAIIGQFKGACTRRIRAAGISDFAWQPRFWDRVIRSEHELEATQRYIANNPLQWHLDRLHPIHPQQHPPT